MVDDKKPGCRTEIVYDSLTFKPTIPPNLFTLESLRQRGR
jgi:hypothetical protein